MISFKNIFLLIVFIAFQERLSAETTFQLRVEYVENPIGINTDKPRFSWIPVSSARNQFQSAWEIIVSDNEGDLKNNKGKQWSTGKVASGQSLHIVYGGEALKSFTRYFWKLRIYNQAGEASDWSPIAFFETAMMQPADWKAKWISDGSKLPEKDSLYYLPDPMPLFRKGFIAKKKIAAARLYITGVGYYEVNLNGSKVAKSVGDRVLEPGWTTYRKQVLYTVHDIKDQLKKGNNVVGVMLGNGWWNPLPFRIFGRWLLRDYQQTGRPCLKAEIHITYGWTAGNDCDR